MKGESNVPMLKDIAEKVGVSVMTVSNVLRPRKEGQRIKYSVETREKVLEAAKELGYVPNRSARAMRTRQTGVIGFVAMNFFGDRVQNYLVHPFLIGLNHALSKTGRHVTLVELNELELASGEQLPEALRERYFDALVVHFGLSQNALRLIEEYKIPMIYWDFGATKENGLMRDEFEIARAVTNRLLDLGHRRIAYLPGGEENWRAYRHGRPSHYSYAARYEGFAAAMKARKLRARVMLGYDSQKHADQLVEDKITGLITQSGSILAYRAASILRWKIPEELSVLTLDSEVSLHQRVDEVGGATYNRYEAGRTAGQMLLERMSQQGKSVANVLLPFMVNDGKTLAKPRPE